MADDTSFRALLIEDNLGDARYIRELFREAGELSERAFDGGRGLRTKSAVRGGSDTPELSHEQRLESGLERLADDEWDVVLLDLDLPDSSGLDTLTTVRKQAPTVPIVVLTGLDDRQTGQEALRQGADEYLVKDEVTADLLVRSVYHAIERLAHEHELKRHETLIEESTDVNVIVDSDGTFQYVTPSAERIFGYEPDELIGENGFDYIHSEDRAAARDEFAAMLEEPEYRPTIEFRFRHRDGSWLVLQARGRNLLDDPMIEGLVVYTHEITGRKEYERQLEQQREQLAALNQLNGVVQEITDAVISQSTREEIEVTVCECLAETESYLFAWIGEVDTATDTVAVRTEAGADEYLDRVAISTDPDDERSEGPTGRAIQTQEMQTMQNVWTDPQYEPWREQAVEHGVQSSAAIPISHEETLYGVLNVYADRPNAFTGEERTVVGQLGEIVGHAIAAVERKRALISDELVELELRIRDYFETIGAPVTADDQITFDQALPLGEEAYRLYGETTADGLEALEALAAQHAEWTDLVVHEDTGETVRFEIRLAASPVLTAVTSSSGSVEQAVIEKGALQLTIHLPRGGDVRQVLETMQGAYPSAEPRARRQISRSSGPDETLHRAWMDELTDRQQTVLRAAYSAGFFEWPRENSGEDVAESLEISPATFSQHVRIAENKLFGALFERLSNGE